MQSLWGWSGVTPVPWWDFLPLAVVQCGTLSSAIDSLRQHNSHTCPEMMLLVMERGATIEWAGLSPVPVLNNHSPLVTISSYPVTSWHPLIEPTACKGSEFKMLHLHCHFFKQKVETHCLPFLHQWVHLSKIFFLSWNPIWWHCRPPFLFTISHVCRGIMYLYRVRAVVESQKCWFLLKN